MLIKSVQHPEIKLMGLKVRTKNKDEFDPKIAKIGAMITRYWNEKIAEKIPHRKHPGVTLVGYSNYESDENGEYDYYFGEEVSSLDSATEDLFGLVIPAGKYLEITSGKGKMPNINIETWQNIWKMTRNNKLGGQRLYQTDFEIYDQPMTDPNNVGFKIYLGIK